MIASNRRHMSQMLDDLMSRSRAQVRAGATKDKTHVKTYLVEASLPENTKPAQAHDFVESLLPLVKADQISDLSLSPATNDTLISVQAKVSGEPITAYVDFTNPRFWFVHSMGDSKKTDWLIARWVGELPELDHAWFPTSFLENCEQFGSIRGVGLDYNRTWLNKDDTDDTRVGALTMQVRGQASKRILGVMRRQNAAPNETPLAKVTVRLNGGRGLDDVRYDGKLVGRGKSFEDHLSLASNLYGRYQSQVRLVESDYAIGPEKSGRCLTIQGEPITFTFDRPIQDMTLFSEGMFAGTEPFKLWGVPVRHAEDYYTVQAFDLHSARPLAFELSPKAIRLYLPKGSCGNSVLRFYANLQHRYDAMVQAVNGSGDPVFAF